MGRTRHLWRFGLVVAPASTSTIPRYGDVLGSFSSSNGGGSGSNNVYNAELWIGTNCTAPTPEHRASPGQIVSRPDQFWSTLPTGIPDVISAGNNTNFAALTGFFTTTLGVGYMANVAMGNGGSATQSNVSLSSKFGGRNPPFPGNVVTSFVYTLTRINIDTSSCVSFS